MKTLVYRRCIVSLDKQHLKSRLQYLRHAFHDFNENPHQFITKLISEVEKDLNKRNVSHVSDAEIHDNENIPIKRQVMIFQ